VELELGLLLALPRQEARPTLAKAQGWGTLRVFLVFGGVKLRDISAVTQESGRDSF